MTNATLLVPDEHTRVLRLSYEDLRREYSLRTFHLRERGALVAAEGKELAYTLDTTGATGVDAVQDTVFAYYKSSYRLKCISDNEGYQYLEIPAVHTVVRAWDENNNPRDYLVGARVIKKITAGATATLNVGKGGTSAVLHAERIFAAANNCLYYSEPLRYEDWTDARGKAGWVQFYGDAGKLLSLQSYKEKLCIFRERGITLLRVLGDELNFKAVHMPYGCGDLIAGSVALCGDEILFFTKTGAYLFNGARCTAAPDARWEEINLSQPVKAVSYQGRYYALLTHRERGQVIYCYDLTSKTAHLCMHTASDVAAGNKLLFLDGDRVFSLTEQGEGRGGEYSFTAQNIAFSASGSKTLRRVAVEGEGNFTVEITSSEGTRTVTGRAGEVLRLRSPLRGNGFCVCVSTRESGARFCALNFVITENDDGN